MEDLEAVLGGNIPSHEQRKSLEALIAQAVELQATVESTEEMLKSLKSDLHTLLTFTIPDAMGATRELKVETPRGLAKVSTKDFVNGSLPKDEEPRRAAFNWLINHDGEGLIKREISMSFPRGDNSVGAVREALERLGVAFNEKLDVHPSTLQAFARERLKKGEEIDTETLGLYAGRAAKIALPKSE